MQKTIRKTHKKTDTPISRGAVGRTSNIKAMRSRRAITPSFYLLPEEEEILKTIREMHSTGLGV